MKEDEEQNRTVSRFFRPSHKRPIIAIRSSHHREASFSSNSTKSRTSGTSTGRNQSASLYFCRSTSSAWGAAQRQQPVCAHLLPEFCGKSSYCYYDESRTQNERETIAMRHFGSCSFFRERWAQFDENSLASLASDYCELEQRLDHAVRHLCSCKCYLRAFAPCRDFWSLRQAVTAALDDDEKSSTRLPLSVDASLRGWVCFLLPPEETESLMMVEAKAEARNLPRTIFVDPVGNQFSSISKALQYLLRKNQHSSAQRESSPSSAVVTPTRETHAASPASDNAACSIKATVLASAITAAHSPNLYRASTPYGLLEELFVDDPWRLLLSTIFLNRTSRVQVDAILHEFLSRWPTAQSVVNDNADNESLASMSQLLQPMGMRHRRAAGIVRFSREYLELLSTKQEESADAACCADVAFELARSDILGLYYCGEYAYAAYQIFIQRNYVQMDPPDHALKVYVEYQRGQYCDVLSQHKKEKHLVTET